MKLSATTGLAALCAIAGLAAPVFAGEAYKLTAVQPGIGVDESVEPADRLALAHDSFIKLRAAAWFTGLEGEADFEGIEGSNGSLDFEDDLGIDSDELAIWATVGFNFGEDWHLNVSYTGGSSYDGNAEGVDITFDDTRFTGDVESEFRLNLWDIEVLYDITDSDPVTFSLGGGVKIIDVELKTEGQVADASGASAFDSESEEAVVPIPVVSALLRWDITRNLYVQGAGSGMYAGDYGIIYDVSAEVGFDITRNFGVFGGYRFLHAESDFDGGSNSEGNDFEFDLHGPFVGGVLRF